MNLRSHESAGPRPRRRDRRFPVDLWAIETNGEETHRHRVANLSVTGMFLQQSVPIPVGHRFRLAIALPNGHTIRGNATVVHATATEDGPGYGVTLANLWHEDHDALVDYLSTILIEKQ